MESSKKQMGWKHETRHIVAVLDLLGASEMIMDENSEAVMNVISNMFKAAESRWPRLEHAPVILHNIKCVSFSDNIALALELPEDLSKEEMNASIESFIAYISVFQSGLLKKKFLFRGGIAIGQLYMNPNINFVWGKALVEAHLLEEKSAIYPRVVLSNQFLNLDLPSTTRIIKDFDGMYFVDYFSKVKEKFPKWIENSQKMIKDNYAKYAGKERVLQKYAWLQHYIE